MDSAIDSEMLSVSALLLNLLLGIVLSVPVAWYYARFGESLSNRARFARLIPMLSLVTILVISVIKVSLALSLGLVGALSIVRFRTAIKDPEELLYLFLAIAIGVGLGANQRIITLVAAAVIMGVLAVVRVLSPRSARRNLYLNVQVSEGDPGGQESATFQSVSEILKSRVRLMDLRRIDYHDRTLQMTYLLDCRDQGTLVALMDDLRQAVPGASFSFIDQHGLPSV